MRKLEGNRTIAHSGGDALDRTVTHVTGYLLARLAQLVHRSDVAGPGDHSIRRRDFSAELEEERFCPIFFEFLLIALKECYHAFRCLQSILVPGR